MIALYGRIKNQNMQPNPYVYPFVPFENLSNKSWIDNFIRELRVSMQDISARLNAVLIPQPKASLASEIAPRVLDIFKDEEYRFGPLEVLNQEEKFWKARIEYFVAKNEPIHAIILGFPFKMPVPIKTNRILPDMGEVLILQRLFTLTELVKKIYPPGLRVQIFTEGSFASFTGLSAKEADDYRDRVAELIRLLGYDRTLYVTDLKDVEAMIPDFSARYAENVEKMKVAYAAGDPRATEQYRGSYPSIFRIVSSRGYKEEDLMDVYNEELSDIKILGEVQAIREDIKKRAHEAVFQYHSYHKTRNDSGVMDRVAPNTLYLTVAPKPGRLGIYPIAKEVVRLPYHGVPVFHEKTGRFTIEYLVDVRRRKGPYTKVFLEGDRDPAPFYYIER